jgi:hypothetical protein
VLSGLVQLMPTVTMAAIALLLSILTRNSLIGVAGPVLLGLVLTVVCVGAAAFVFLRRDVEIR